MLFGETGADRPLTVVDWQTVTVGPALTDVAYFLGCALPTEQRRAHYDDLLRAYHEALGPDAAADPRRRPRGRAPPELLRSDDVDRVADAGRAHRARRRDVHDDDRAALRNTCSTPTRWRSFPSRRVPEPLQPNADDEGAHPPTDEPLWNESWYFDFADPAQNVGGWIRLGLIPNQGHAWVNALLCGPDMPTIAVLDFEAPLPADHTHVRTDDVDLELRPSRTAAVATG